MLSLKKILIRNIIKDFAVLATAPLEDEKAVKSIKDSVKVGPDKNFASYIFGNLILGSKS